MSTPAHKRAYVDYLAVGLLETPDGAQGGDAELEAELAQRAAAQALLDAFLATLPNDGAPADGYAYASHMGAALRALDHATDELLKARRSFYRAQGGATTTTKKKST